MNGKKLLAGIVINSFLLAGCYQDVRQSVSAETIESRSAEKEIRSTEQIQSSSAASRESTTPSKEAQTDSLVSAEESSVQLSSSMVSKSVETKTAKSAGTTESIPSAFLTEKVEDTSQFSVVRNQTTEGFIQLIGWDAQQIAWNEGLYASVMIAQAILETGAGNSQLARPPHHNLFGIKGSYQGKQVTFNTKEDKGNGQLYTIQAAFRQYPSYKESLEDYAALLRNGLSGNPNFYQGVWKEQAATYQEATKGLTGKYATDTSYDQKLNALIETYNLTSYDQEPDKEKAPNEEDQQKAAIAGNDSQQSDTTTSESLSEERSVIRSETTQAVVIVSPITQRPAKQVSGNQVVQ